MTRNIRFNSYIVGDAIEFLTRLKPRGITGIAMSPPYNKAFNGRGRKPGSNWKNSKLMADNYSHFEDNLPEADYINWQRKIIETSLDCVGDDGVVLYNIGRKIKNLQEDRRERIIDGFPVRQTVIWNRGSTHNQGGKRPTILPPIYEIIYIIAGMNWRLPEKYVTEMRYWGDVWRIVPEMRNPHPAPFPLELAVRMAKLINGPLADPFAGSGTMGIAAMEIDVPYILNDISPEYRKMFLQTAKNIQTTRRNFMQSLIVPHLSSNSLAKEIYIDEIDRLDGNNYEPHEFVVAMMSAYQNLIASPDRSVHGRFFEFVIGETLVQQGVKFLYYQAEVRHVPLATFDWFMYHETHPVSVSCKTKARDRWKQAAHESMGLKQVYVQATNYLVTIEQLSAVEEKKKLSPNAIDHYVVATTPEYSNAVREIAQREYIEAIKMSPVIRGNLLAIN